jgi:hypothetical protein
MGESSFPCVWLSSSRRESSLLPVTCTVGLRDEEAISAISPICYDQARWMTRSQNQRNSSPSPPLRLLQNRWHEGVIFSLSFRIIPRSSRAWLPSSDFCFDFFFFSVWLIPIIPPASTRVAIRFPCALCTFILLSPSLGNHLRVQETAGSYPQSI